MVFSNFCITETRREGQYDISSVLFSSQTNSVNVKFTSDGSVRRFGFKLDAQSVTCGEY